ncbi:hypothetical protein AADZ90_021825 [Aestuariibius sp. 2305UL40-4]|uniref:hypothetical protein n=1 Tax=Aestuariibius violaceus TaxID=3234132 RepID=UPI00398F2B48
MLLTSEQCRAARIFLDWRVEDLVARSGLTPDQVRNFEHGRSRALPVVEALQRTLQSHGIRLTANGGVELEKDRLVVIEGNDCYLRLLQEAMRTLSAVETPELLILYASDRSSPPEVNAQYRRMRAAGITMRQIISSNDTYIMGPLEEYRAIPAAYFTNIVTVIYGDSVAQVNGGETRITIQQDPALAERECQTFQYLWDRGDQPTTTTAPERF